MGARKPETMERSPGLDQRGGAASSRRLLWLQCAPRLTCGRPASSRASSRYVPYDHHMTCHSSRVVDALLCLAFSLDLLDLSRSARDRTPRTIASNLSISGSTHSTASITPALLLWFLGHVRRAVWGQVSGGISSLHSLPVKTIEPSAVFVLRFRSRTPQRRRVSRTCHPPPRC